jgi:hypothetical protein
MSMVDNGCKINLLSSTPLADRSVMPVMQFNHVRIPRRAMLSRFAQVSPQGDYITPPHAKLSYGGVSLCYNERMQCCTHDDSEIYKDDLHQVCQFAM